MSPLFEDWNQWLIKKPVSCVEAFPIGSQMIRRIYLAVNLLAETFYLHKCTVRLAFGNLCFSTTNNSQYLRLIHSLQKGKSIWQGDQFNVLHITKTIQYDDWKEGNIGTQVVEISMGNSRGHRYTGTSYIKSNWEFVE